MKLKLIFLLVYSVLFANLALAENSQNFQTKERTLEVTFYSAKDAIKHPSVIMLHGYQCIEACAKDFERYAVALTENGIDVYVLKYYNDSDSSALRTGQLDGPGYTHLVIHNSACQHPHFS